MMKRTMYEDVRRGLRSAGHVRKLTQSLCRRDELESSRRDGGVYDCATRQEAEEDPERQMAKVKLVRIKRGR